mmetsp:Transcript_25347/g.45719  ORF Transcript_25347/g.45719 Transcript_25347/m.45719 type:complete len:383 (+) Transcript_25347:185-1333(+)|eukprot:CAMPEP_0201886292 /NCGR_PEP_ID=MMETSP0902-20130614/21712_1 /ASSEMBLY_ACC=CAM_ASM_000551 /TAXON_ID=420261 /ORGANISM="Thalassiosira antarctica, Strain CCMP982" /LENGTH=382 /DNA_ID=CAMNT_0048415829 /DNA_START=131 /DNA_END=1279 /DNA_ORIENTATION=+
MSTAEGNVAVALGLVCGAGAATAIGSSVVFFPSLVKLASRRVLAGSLGLSAGVMTYVSFAEIFVKSVDGFALAGIDPDLGYIYATLSFFGGVLTMLLVDIFVKLLSGDYHQKHHEDIQFTLNENERGVEKKNDEPEVVIPHCVGCSDDPVGELNEWQQRAEEELEGRADTNTKTSATIVSNEIGTNYDADNSGSEGNRSNDSFKDNQDQKEEHGNKVVVENGPTNEEHDQKKLVKMGLSTAVAIAIHNFPEGLATFVAALDDPSVGAVLAVAIGIHNIPEGLCVALPIYYATGNRWKAFMWGCLSGASEPIAALLGWAILAKTMSETVYAILFGLVSGMMVIISLKELIPTAHRYDPEDTVVTYSIIGGMFIIALSLVLFKI